MPTHSSSSYISIGVFFIPWQLGFWYILMLPSRLTANLIEPDVWRRNSWQDLMGYTVYIIISISVKAKRAIALRKEVHFRPIQLHFCGLELSWECALSNLTVGRAADAVLCRAELCGLRRTVGKGVADVVAAVEGVIVAALGVNSVDFGAKTLLFFRACCS